MIMATDGPALSRRRAISGYNRVLYQVHRENYPERCGRYTVWPELFCGELLLSAQREEAVPPQNKEDHTGYRPNREGGFLFILQYCYKQDKALIDILM